MSAFNNASKKRKAAEVETAGGEKTTGTKAKVLKALGRGDASVVSAAAATGTTLASRGTSSSSSSSSSGSALYNNKQRVLILSSRGITARYRHLMEDMKKLIPHHKKDNKLDTKGDIHVVNEIAELKSCNQIMYFETKKNQDLYMYLGKAPHGPSVKFQVVNVHTMDELKLTGNCMIGSRPLLNFDARFDIEPHLQLLKVILRDAFGTPKGHPKSKPFVDRIMSFFAVKNTICKLLSFVWCTSCTYCILLIY